jgi:outer membrane protein assembly factor BamB
MKMLKKAIIFSIIALMDSGQALADWTMYQHDPAHTARSEDAVIQASNVSDLSKSWTFRTRGWVSGTPIVAGGLVYIGSWDGSLYALREGDGSLVWSFNAGRITDNCGNSYGIDSTAAFSDGKLFFASASSSLYALDAATGSLLWEAKLADPAEGFHIWSSPLVFDGKIYIGLASHCDNPCVRGQIFCLNASNGQTLWTFYTAPEGSTGGGVWSSLAVDEQRRLVYATTGNFCSGEDTYSDSIIALQADYGYLVWHYKNINRDSDDLDFGASPVLFDVDGVPMLAAGSKDGHCYCLNRATGQLIWNTEVTDGDSEGGIISSPAAGYGLIFMGTSKNGNEKGKVVALDQRDGHIVWEVEQSKPVYSPATIAGGAVFIGGLDGIVRAYDAMTGLELWSAAEGAPIFGGVSISAGKIFFGSALGNVNSFSVSGPRISIQNLPMGRVGHPYSATLQASGEEPLTWSLASGQLPPGLSLSFTGEITGTPTAEGTFSFTVQVLDKNNQSALASLKIIIEPGELIKLNTPLLGEVWFVGYKYRVSWSATSGINQVDISISRDGGNTWTLLLSKVDASLGSILIKAKKPRSDSVRLKVADSSNPNIFAQSEVFQIK